MKSVGRGYSCVSRIHIVFFFSTLFLTFTYIYLKYEAVHVESINIDFYMSAGGMCRYTGTIQAYMTDFATSCTISQMHTIDDI